MKPTFQTMVVPLDGTDTAEQAIPLGIEIAQKYAADLVFFRVLSLPPFTWNLQTVPNFDGLQTQMTSVCQEYLEEMQKKHETAGLNIECRFSVGVPANEIIALAEKCPRPMVVMATHGRDGLQRWMLGSVAERVARYAPCPVLLVRTDFEETENAKNTRSD